MKPKNFDPAATLHVIAETFARNGYEGTSLEDLTKSTGLGKQSLYDTYGDKKAMLTKSLECFGLACASADILRNTSLKGRERIEGFFNEMLKDSDNPSHGGCLVTNLLLEKGASDIAVLRLATKRWNMTRLALQQVVEEGHKDKSIASKLDAELVSYALMNLLNGLRVTMRTMSDGIKIKQMMSLTLKSLL